MEGGVDRVTGRDLSGYLLTASATNQTRSTWHSHVTVISHPFNTCDSGHASVRLAYDSSSFGTRRPDLIITQ